METHAVPQEIMGVEFKLFGNFLSLREFLFIAFGLVIAYIFYFLYNNGVLPIILALPAILFFGVGGTMIGLVPIQDRSLDKWIVNYFAAINRPTQRVWSKPGFSPATTTSDVPVITKEHVISPPVQPAAMSSGGIGARHEEKADASTIAVERTASEDLSQINAAFDHVERVLAPASDGQSPTVPFVQDQTEPVYIQNTSTPQFAHTTPVDNRATISAMPVTDDRTTKPLYPTTGPEDPAVPVSQTLDTPVSDTPVTDTSPASTPDTVPAVSSETPSVVTPAVLDPTMSSQTNDTPKEAGNTIDLRQSPDTQSQPQIISPVDQDQPTSSPGPVQQQNTSRSPVPSTPAVNPNVIAIDDSNINDYTTTITSLESKPNTINIVVKDTQGLILPAVVCVIKNSSGYPVRAAISNVLGQILNNVPLKSGMYRISLTKQGYVFPEITRNLKGKVYPPIEIKAL